MRLKTALAWVLVLAVAAAAVYFAGYFALELIFAVFVAIAFGALWALVGAGAGAVVGHANEVDNLGRLVSGG
jgi:predicted MFS family arabinose efflux permease